MTMDPGISTKYKDIGFFYLKWLIDDFYILKMYNSVKYIRSYT